MPKTNAKTQPETTSVFTFRVELKYEPEIWRRIAIRGDQTLDQLHQTIFEAFDRDDEHLYSFYLPPPGLRGRVRRKDIVEYTHSVAVDNAAAWDDEAKVFDAAEATIDSLQLKRGRKFEYLFDFGDNWEHVLTVEQTDGLPDRKKYPRILERHGASPPQYPEFDEGGDFDTPHLA